MSDDNDELPSDPSLAAMLDPAYRTAVARAVLMPRLIPPAGTIEYEAYNGREAAPDPTDYVGNRLAQVRAEKAAYREAVWALVKKARTKAVKVARAYPSGRTRRGHPLPKPPENVAAAGKGQRLGDWLKKLDRSARRYIAAADRLLKEAKKGRKAARDVSHEASL